MKRTKTNTLQAALCLALTVALVLSALAGCDTKDHRKYAGDSWEGNPCSYFMDDAECGLMVYAMDAEYRRGYLDGLRDSGAAPSLRAGGQK